MPDFSRQPTPLIVVSSIFFLMLAVARVVASPSMVELAGENIMPLSVWLEGCRTTSMWLYVSLVGVALLACMIGVLRTSIFCVEVGRRSVLPLQMWVLVGCGVAFPQRALTAYVAAFIMTIALKSVARSFKRSYSFGPVFSASFAFGVLPLLYAPFVVIYPALGVVWAMCRRTFREFFVGVVGVLLPVLATSYIDWLSGGEGVQIFRALADGVVPSWSVELTVFQEVVLGVMLLQMVSMLVAFVLTASTLRAKPRVMGYVQLILGGALLLALVLGGDPIVLIPTLAVLMALLLPNVFGRRGVATLSSINYMLVVVVVLMYNIGALFLL